MVKRGNPNKKLTDQLVLMELEIKKSTAVTAIAMAFTIFAITVPLYLDLIQANTQSITIIVIVYISAFFIVVFRQGFKLAKIIKKIEEIKTKLEGKNV